VVPIGKSSKFIKNPVIYVKKLIIMLIQFKFGHILAYNRAVLAIWRNFKRSHLNLFLWNRWTKLNQTWQRWPLGGSLSKLCPSTPSCIQDGHHY
jgi:hypothetical protein